MLVLKRGEAEVQFSIQEGIRFHKINEIKALRGVALVCVAD